MTQYLNIDLFNHLFLVFIDHSIVCNVVLTHADYRQACKLKPSFFQLLPKIFFASLISTFFAKDCYFYLMEKHNLLYLIYLPQLSFYIVFMADYELK